MRRSLVALAALVAVPVVAGCGGGQSATVRAHAQAVQACTSAQSSGAGSADALVHSHQAAGLDASWSGLATAFGQVGVLKQSFGSDLGAGEDDQTGTSAMSTIVTTCATLGVTVSPTATGSTTIP